MKLIKKTTPVIEFTSQSPNIFFGRLLQARDIAHLTHLRQPDLRFSTHKALNELYDEILDTIDTIIESWQGIYGTVDITIPQSQYQTEPATWVKELYNYIMSTRVIFKESWLQNEIDTICTLLAQTLYRLNFTK